MTPSALTNAASITGSALDRGSWSDVVYLLLPHAIQYLPRLVVGLSDDSWAQRR